MQGYQRARALLEDNRDTLTQLAETLLEYESLDAREIESVIRGEKLTRKAEAPRGGDTRREEPRKPAVAPLIKPNEKPSPA